MEGEVPDALDGRRVVLSPEREVWLGRFPDRSFLLRFTNRENGTADKDAYRWVRISPQAMDALTSLFVNAEFGEPETVSLKLPPSITKEVWQMVVTLKKES